MDEPNAPDLDVLRRHWKAKNGQQPVINAEDHLRWERFLPPFLLLTQFRFPVLEAVPEDYPAPDLEVVTEHLPRPVLEAVPDHFPPSV